MKRKKTWTGAENDIYDAIFDRSAATNLGSKCKLNVVGLGLRVKNLSYLFHS